MLMGNKKVDLGHVWMAAHFPHRIRKEFVQQTNISSSVDKILVDQVPVVTYRILGFLLLGVTRLYSKKVEYLLIDCNHSLYEMKVYFEGRKKVNINVGGMCLPEPSSQRSKTNIVAMDAPESSSRKKSNTFIDAMRAEFSSITLPENFELDAFDLQVVEDESSSEHHVKSNLEIVLPDTDAWENDETGHHSEASPENLRTRFSLEDRLAPMELDEPNEEVTLPKIPFLEQDPEWRNTNSCDNYMTFEDRNDKHQDEEECTTGEKEEKSVLETLMDDNITVKPSPQKLSVAVNVTPQSKGPSVSGKHKSDSMAVRTPAVQERVSVSVRASISNSRKRKCVYDDITVIRNVVYKDWVTNASDLVAKRTKVPTTRSRTRSCDYFIQPIIPLNAGFPSDLRSAISRIEVEQLQLQSAIEVVDDGVGVGIGSCAAAAAIMQKSVEENEAEIIAPLTPTTQSASKANQEGPTSSCEDVFPINDQELDNLQSVSRQGPSSSHLQNQGHENWSALTKSVGGYLHSSFTHKKDEVVKLSQILKQKTKRESAMFFSEILVLKTGGYVDVKQKKAYDEIFVMQTLKMKEVFGADTRE
ncbi:unnamed protein product [Lactuca virosa]|uniref:Rad21/Rec8-like protein N-terminal domain-containing protein n=1 Tax=Lactuca virosa TaxID=75947 RepID=A0AAU9LY71_9ASTR|nr:unnamed protein product [Lactuca virosa]